MGQLPTNPRSVNPLLLVIRAVILIGVLAILISLGSFAAELAYGIYTKDSQAFCNLAVIQDRILDEQGAFNSLAQAIKLNPNNAGAYLYRGVLRYNQGDKQGGILDLLQAAKLNPKYQTAYFALGFAYQNVRENQKSIDSCSKALALDPADASALVNRGVAHLHLKEYKQALTDITGCINLRPNTATEYMDRSIAYLEAGDFKKSMEDLNHAYKNLGLTNYFNHGIDSYVRKDFTTGITDFTKLITNQDPSQTLAYYFRGCAYSKLNQFQQAINDFDKVIDTLSNSSNTNRLKSYAYYQRATASYKIGDKQGAIADLKQAKELNAVLASTSSTQAPKVNYQSAGIYLERGDKNEQMGNLQGAVNDYTQAIKITAGHPGNTYVQSSDYASNFYFDPVASYKRDSEGFAEPAYVLDEQSLAAMPYLLRGCALSKLGKFNDSIKDLSQAINIDPGCAPAYSIRSVDYFATGDQTLALKDNYKELDLNPGDKLCRIRAMRSLTSGIPAEAVKSYEKWKHCDKEGKSAPINESPRGSSSISPASMKL